MIVYADLIFMMNFSIDAAVLMTTAWTRKTKIVWWRITLSSLIGALYVISLLFPPLNFLYSFAIKGIFSLGMIFIAFGFSSLQHFIGNLGVFYLINFFVAGGIFGIHYFMQSSDELWNGMFVTSTGGLRFELEMGIIFVISLLVLLLILYRVLHRTTKRRESRNGYLAEVAIFIDGLEWNCIGLVDTGNQLYDPLTRTPVMVVEAKLWEQYLPETWMDRIRKSEAELIVSSLGNEPDFPWQNRLRLVPFRGINKGTQFMLAMKPDRVVITYNEQTTESSRVFIGMNGGKLCSDGAYQAVIHPMLLEA